MDNQPSNAGHGRPGALDGDTMDQTGKLADARGISDLSKNSGKEETDEAVYADEATRDKEQKDNEPTKEDFEPFDLDALEE